jgi:hypothetical protein
MPFRLVNEGAARVDRKDVATNPHRIYLDYNASTPIAAEVVTAMRPFLDGAYGNPSSRHWAGKPAREAVEGARDQVARLLGCASDEVVFTSGGSEANNHVLKGVAFALRENGDHIVDMIAGLTPRTVNRRPVGRRSAWQRLDSSQPGGVNAGRRSTVRGSGPIVSGGNARCNGTNL